jgi:endonuclease-8
MPEGDTLFRTARTLHRALAGRCVTRFDTVLPRLARVDADRPLAGRLVQRVEARGKHLLIWFEGDLVLRTHLRMHGSWHIYRPGECWQRPRHDMRILIETPDMHAVAFTVPVAEFTSAAGLERTPALRDLGPDPLSASFDPEAAVDRLLARPDIEIAEALLDQRAIAGIGNEYKSEVLFLGRIDPCTPVRALPRDEIARLVDIAARLLRANVSTGSHVALSGVRRTTPRDDPSARLWVYARAGAPCRRCGTPISRRKQGPHARQTYWCAKCQPGVIEP